MLKFFRKGTGTFLYGFFIMMICFLIALVIIEQFSMYIHATDTQMVADSISDGVAVYMSTNSSATYDDAKDRAKYIRKVWKDNTNVNPTSVKIDKDRLENENIVEVVVKAKYRETSSVDEFEGIDDLKGGGNHKKTYNIQRMAATSFTASYSGDYLYPLSKVYNHLSSGFVYRGNIGPNASTEHKGIDIPAPNGTPIYCSASGVVEKIYGKELFNRIVVNHGKNAEGHVVKTFYEHNSRNLVHVGQSVTQGQLLAEVGGMGRAGNDSYGKHLDYRCEIDGVLWNPLYYCFGMRYEPGMDPNAHSASCNITAVDGEITSLNWSTRDVYRAEKMLGNIYYQGGFRTSLGK